MNIHFIVISALLLFFNCKSQNIEKRITDKDEVLLAFFKIIREPTFVSDNIDGTSNLQEFKNIHSINKRLFAKSDSICSFSEDPNQLKLYCPTAYNSKDLAINLSEEDIISFEENTDSLQQKLPIKLIQSLNPFIKSKTENLDATDTCLNTYIEISNVYLNSKKDKGLVVFSKKYFDQSSYNRFYIVFKLERGIWWRQVGQFPLQ